MAVFSFFVAMEVPVLVLVVVVHGSFLVLVPAPLLSLGALFSLFGLAHSLGHAPQRKLEQSG